MLDVKFDQRKIAELEKSLGAKKKRLPVEIKIAVNATARKAVGLISKNVRAELNVKAKYIKDKRLIDVRPKATESTLTARVTLKKSARIPLREFGARQTKRGVSYRISKTQGRSIASGAFQGPRPGVINIKWRGRVFKRVGKNRLPITQLYGPSPWGVFVKKSMREPVVFDTEKELQKQLDRRIRKNVLQSQGVIK